MTMPPITLDLLIFLGMVVNLIVLLGAHYLLGEKGGWEHNPIPRNQYGYIINNALKHKS